MADTNPMASLAAEKRVELLLQQLDELPTLPAVAVRLLEETAGHHSELKDVAAVLGSDPSLSAHTLQLCHRADLGVRGIVTTVEQAVRLIGFDELRRMVLAVSVFQVFQVGDAVDSPFNTQEFWRHSLAVACCAEALARVANLDSSVDPADAFLAGLLHDIGKIALHVILPKSYARVVDGVELLRGNIADLERSVIGLDHLMVGKRLAERWGLPQMLTDVIWLHGQRSTAMPDSVGQPRLVNLVSLADEMVRGQHLGYSGNYTPSDPGLWSTELGLTPQQLTAVLNGLGESMTPHAAMLGLDQSTTGAVYVQALTRANQELNRVSQQLSAKNRKLAGRAKCFQSMASFHQHLRPDATASVVLRAIASSAADALTPSTGTPGEGRSEGDFERRAVTGKPENHPHPLPEYQKRRQEVSVAIFSTPPSADFAEVHLPDEQLTILDFPNRPQAQAVGVGPVLAADANLEPILDVVSPQLSDDKRFWIALHADGHCIGGIVWGAPPGEAERLGTIAPELLALAHDWALALRAAQVRDDGRRLAEQLVDANRRLSGAETELARARAMLTVGEMAAGAAHEMNNPLAVISGRSQLLASQLTDAKQKQAATLIHDQSQRLSNIITELMEFARPQPANPAAASLADVVSEAIHLAKARSNPADRNINATLTSVPLIRVDAGQTAAAIAELIANAIEATDSVTGRIELHAAYDAVSSRVVLTITDNGCGMDDRTLSKAFDPFFSAKPAGRRRGMGLPKAMRWLEASGGSVRLERRSGPGAVARVLLPVAVGTIDRTESGAPPAVVNRKVAT